MSTEITRHQSTTPVSMPEKMQYAEALAAASLLPRAYQRQPGNVLLAMEMGDALGIPPIQAINDIHVIEGKPSASANLIGALVRKAGHKLRVTGDDTQATAQVIRADDPDFTFEVTWTLDRARTAGLLNGKGNWSKYPAAMLKARAITEVARTACPDALYGVIYTPEELGAVVTEDGAPASRPQAAPAPQSQGARGGSRLAQAVQSRPQPQPTPAPAGEFITPDTWARIQAALAASGYEGDAQGEAIQTLLDKRIDGPQHITVQDGERLLAELEPPTPEADAVTGEVIDEPAAA